ncbi:MAG TPA: adenylate kinase [Chloroflexota bacterium]|jgi:adenylate kinase|nr:adenylate kinase [Chloroflexota bacterium]
MIVVMLGPPGAGKGTQCELLGEKLALPHIATGDLLREAMARGTPLGQLARPYIERGELVPDDVMINIINEWLATPGHEHGFILDGFPRTVNQARALDQALARVGKGVDRVIYLSVPVEELLQRIAGRYVCPQCGASYHLRTSPPRQSGYCDQCGSTLTQRPDDRREVAERRMAVYFAQTAPVIDYYQKRGVLSEVNGAQSVTAVLDAELAILLTLPSRTHTRTDRHGDPSQI